MQYIFIDIYLSTDTATPSDTEVVFAGHVLCKEIFNLRRVLVSLHTGHS